MVYEVGSTLGIHRERASALVRYGMAVVERLPHLTTTSRSDDVDLGALAAISKFRANLFDLLPGIVLPPGKSEADHPFDEFDIPDDFRRRRAHGPSGRPARAQDPRLRAAIERRSLDVALAYYERIGGAEARELGEPYDIAASVDRMERHREVKGSSVIIETVELTINEVIRGTEYENVDLVVVDGIDVTRDDATGEIHTAGGRLRVWTDWSPASAALKPQWFDYSLPSDPRVCELDSYVRRCR